MKKNFVFDMFIVSVLILAGLLCSCNHLVDSSS